MSESESSTECEEDDEDKSQVIPIDELLTFCEENGLQVVQKPKSQAGVTQPNQAEEVENLCPVSQSSQVLSSQWNVNDRQIIEPLPVSPISLANLSNHSSNIQVHRQRIITPSAREKQKQTWKQHSNMTKRMRGDDYLGFRTVTNSTTKKKTTVQTVNRKARLMGQACLSNYCKKSKIRYCSTFSHADRSRLHSEFWKNMDWGEKQTNVRSLVDRVGTKHYKKSETGRRRTTTYNYFLKQNGTRKQVCQQMFLNTLSLGKHQVNKWVEERSIDKATKTRTFRTPRGGDRVFYKEFLENIPKLPSHYCRQDTNKLYIEPQFHTKQELYKAYQSKCVEKKVTPTSTFTFYVYFRQQNYALHQPKKDLCDICSSKEAGNFDRDEYHTHILKKESARQEKIKDKKRAKEGEIHVVTMDVQKVLLSPLLNASALYYKTKLMVHNFTVFDLGSNDATCYLFDESEAELVSSTFATCLIKYFDNHFKDNLSIVIYSDGCTSQNRNGYLSSALLHYAQKNNKVIIQKYLEKGHTQMECDSVHAVIERALQKQRIYVPSDYTTICEQARSDPRPYEVIQMIHENFYDYCSLKCNIRPGHKKGDPVVTDLRQLKYDLDGRIYYKLQHSDDEWSLVPHIPKLDLTFNFPRLYNQRLPISKRKYQDLQDVLHVIPECYHNFYKLLPCKSS